MKQVNVTQRQPILTALIMTMLGLSAPSLANTIEVSERTNITLSGKVVGAVIADSDVSGMGVNNLPNGLFGKNNDPSVAIDTTLTRLNLGSHTQFAPDETLKSLISFDFNSSNNGKMDLRMREAYVDWQIGNRSLLVGQTWSTLMDLNRFPDTVLEPTLSGVVFTRQPMVRWSQQFGSFRYDIALESGSNRVVTEDHQVDLDTSSHTPDFIFGLQTDNEHYWLRAAGVVNRITVKDQQQSTTYSDTGWALHLSGGIKFNPKDHLQLAYFNSRGNDRYVLGVSQTGPLFTPGTGDFHLRESESLWAAVGHSWTDTLKSTFSYGIWQADALEWQADTFTQTQFALANIKWLARKNLTFGLEYNYTHYQRSRSDQRDNHRLILAVDYAF